MERNIVNEGRGAGSLEYFDIQAFLGTTKHMGGLAATRDLAAMCEVSEGDRVLEVGSGAGATACWLAEKYDCRVTGIDLHPEMMQLGTTRARRRRLQDQAFFREGSVEDLPFDEGEFDVVLCESVLSFVDRKQQAVDECVRVLKPGGRLGINEEIWLRKPAADELEAAHKLWSMSGQVMMEGDWQNILQATGLQEVRCSLHTMSAWREASQVLRYTAGDMIHMFVQVWRRYVSDPAFRSYLRERRKVPSGLARVLGYGLCSGKKPVDG